jgi:cytochrome c oxidase subunit 2
MEIHRLEKLWLAAALVLIVGFIATVAYGAIGPGVAMVDDSGGTIEAADVRAGNYDATDGFREPGVYQVGEDRYAAYVVAQQFFFAPGTNEPLRLPAGSTVTFYVTSADVIHGFELAGTNVNTMAIPGQVAEVTVEFEEPGTYGMICHEYCGAAHHTMAGQVQVVPASQFQQDAQPPADQDVDAPAQQDELHQEAP